MRRLSIDEMPQLLNVLRGDMSLVGPRPLPAHDPRHLDPEFVALRRIGAPGLTGLWQVAGRSDLDMTGLEQLDRRYLAGPTLGRGSAHPRADAVRRALGRRAY